MTTPSSSSSSSPSTSAPHILPARSDESLPPSRDIHFSSSSLTSPTTTTTTSATTNASSGGPLQSSPIPTPTVSNPTKGRSHASTAPLIAGFMGGVVSTTLLLPLDVIKLRMQVNEGSTTTPTTTTREAATATTLLTVSSTTAADRHRLRPRHWLRPSSSWRIATGIVQHEGLPGLYQGWTAAVLGSSISWGGYFFIYEAMKQHLAQYKATNNQMGHSATRSVARSSSLLTPPPSPQPAVVLTSMDNFILATTASCIMVLLTNPIWLIKTRMQLQMKRFSAKLQQQQQQQHPNENVRLVQQPYRNTVDAFRTVVRDEGLLALYKGSGPALLLSMHGGVQFVVYEYLRKHFHFQQQQQQQQQQQPKPPGIASDSPGTARYNSGPTVWKRFELSLGYLTMGAIAKIIASTVTYPLQVIKTRLQQRTESFEFNDKGQIRVVQREYRGMWHVTRTLWSREGLPGFFKGCIPNAVRVAPGAAITFVVYESVMDYIHGP